MEEAIKRNPDNFCRACLNETPSMVALTKVLVEKQRTLSDVFSFVFNLSIKSREQLPKQICVDCEAMVLTAEKFKERCIQSQKYLSKLFKSKESKHSISSNIKEENPNSKDCTNTRDVMAIECMKNELEANSFSSDDFIAKTLLKKSIKDELSDFSDEHYMDVDNDDSTHNKEATGTENGATLFTSQDYQRPIVSKNKSISLKKEIKKVPVKLKTNFIPIKCEWCERIFKTERTFNKHKRIHHDNPVVQPDVEYFQCSLCMRKFKKKCSLISHLKHHMVHDSIKFSCDICKREFKHQGHLDNHIVSMHNKDKGVTCEYCLSVFATQETLEEHKIEHKNEKKHRCKVCNKVFNMLSTLTDHLRTHTGEKPFLCSICGRGFSQKTNLAQHMRRHLGLKPYKCQECERGFVSKGELDAHLRKHSGAHPFVCGQCGGAFTTSSSLVKHRRVHSGERPYACDLCPMKFKASGTLKNHRRTHTGEKPYQCSYCEKAFVQRQDLVTHIRCHTGERPYVCNVCGQSFRKASGLKTHIRMHKEHIETLPGVILSGVTGPFGGS